jgi:hypothetical protein
VDTLEWGTSDRPARAGRWQGPRWLGPSAAVWLAGAGVALAVAAQVLPWATLGQSGATSGLSLDNLNTISVLGYYLCWIGLLGLTGLVLAGRLATRRAAAGAALGLGAALAMVLAGIIRWIFAGSGFTDSTAPTVSATDASASTSPSLGPGLFCACAAVGLVLAAVLLAARRRTTVLNAGTAPPAAVSGEPVDLTVRPLPRLDEGLFTRPDGS